MNENKTKKPWHKKWWGIALIIFIAFIVIRAIGTTPRESSQNNTSTSKTEKQVEEPIVEVTAKQLADAYENNQVAADQAFKDKIVKITGTIDSIGKDILDTPYITLSSGTEFSLNSVQCMFDDSDQNQLAQLSKGQQVTVVGKVSGQVILGVILDDCKLQ